MKRILLLTALSFATPYITAITPNSHGHANKGKKIDHPDMHALELGLKARPLLYTRMKLTGKSLSNVLAETSDVVKKDTHESVEEKAYILLTIKKILEPVREFFALVEQYKDLIGSVIEESQKDNPHSYLRLYKEKNISIDDFCAHHIVSIKILKEFSLELLSFFDDIDASITAETKKLCIHEYQKMQQKHK